MAAKPKQFNQATQKLITDAAEVGFTFWGEASGTGFTWAIDDRQNFHAVHSTTRGGVRQSRHACGVIRALLDNEIDELSGKAFWVIVGSYPNREITRRQLAMTGWQCDLDGPVIVHPAISTAAVEQIQIEVGA